MVRIRSSNEIILSSLDFYRVAQPLLDTKPGTVSRDVLIDGPSAQLSRLYDELSRISSLQSLRLALGSDLDKLAQNFGAVRQRGSKATGPALLTFKNFDTDISVNKGDLITAKNGATFVASNSLVISPVFASSFKATAAKFKSDLDFVGITDEFATEVLVESSAPGIQGNISKYSLKSTGIVGVNNVTNVTPFGGGKAAEDDASFRTRILSIFSGANTGTSLGYRNAVIGDPSVVDAIVIGPGDPLMTRDGTQVSIAPDGTRTVISEGTGGKVDVLVFGTRLQEVIDSFVYRDLSNTGDPSNTANDFVLGQIAADAGKTVTRKRIDDLAAGILPNQPVNNIVSVTGSLSGPNFAEKNVDGLGRITGNYELVRDTGAFGGSPWGFDRLHWISDRISDFGEDKTKSSFNSQDALSFTDLLEIQSVQQNIIVTNENSKVMPSDRSSIQLSHAPVTNVTRVFNLTTGERYVIVSQNPDGTGTVNNTGRIVINGKTLPAVSDILQVDYTWIFSFDPYFDFDNRTTNSNPRSVRDSIDWGFSNAVRREKATLIASGSSLTATVTHPITSVVSVNTFVNSTGNVTILSGRLAVVVGTTVANVVSIVRNSDGAELWNTVKSDGSFSGLTIFFPTDSAVGFGDLVTVTYNAVDVFNAATQGSFNNNTITIVPSSVAVAGTIVECTYIANVNTILPVTLLPTLPAIRSLNSFNTSAASSVGTQPTTHIYLLAIPNNVNSATIFSNLRQAPSNLGLTIAGSISPGIITVTGTTLSGIFDIVFTVSSAGLKQDLAPVIKTFLGLNSKTGVPSNVKLARVVKVEKVTTTTSLDVLSVDHQYDIKGYHLKDNSFVKEESVQDSTLKTTEMILPSTSDNLSNEPAIGSRLRVRCYISTTGDSENVSFSKSGTLYTNKRFALVDTIAISSGFTSGSSSAATLTVSNLNQPATRSRYKAFYDYLAPKTNERISIDFNFEKIISDATLNVENTRPITADVLVKSAIPVLVDVTMNVVVTDSFKNSTTIVQQNVQDAVTAALNAKALGTIIDSSDLINTAYTVNGVDRARIMFFNKSNSGGSVLSITAQKNEFIVANTVIVNIENR
ncbi:MAG TPA: baseplate J/gp47 family protein [Anaerovoracaceae bacterium]|nr:baseplate J/gp47 family protein [Anaerovoracaceae bacterium]